MRRLADFLGAWTLRRRVTGADGGLVATFAGWAELRGDQDRAAWTEAGRLRPSGGAGLDAMRRYIWSTGPGGTIGVAFADGRPFHGFQPAEETAAARHHCPPDVYDVTYDFSAWPLWRTTWAVDGPRKRWTIETRHAPASACTGQAPAARTAAE